MVPTRALTVQMILWGVCRIVLGVVVVVVVKSCEGRGCKNVPSVRIGLREVQGGL